jgi:acyl dehydratase
MSREVVLEKTFSQADFDRFADLSGDNNPIHVDPEFSANTRFGRTVAHGLLLATVLRGLINELKPGTRQLDQSLMFPAPTFADEPMRFIARLCAADNEIELEVSRIGDGQITCQGRTRVIGDRC